MTTIQDQYTAFAKTGQEATASLVDTWTRILQDASAGVPTATVPAVTPEALDRAIDQAFDLGAQFLDAQRTLAKQYIATSVAAFEQVSSHAKKVATEATTAVVEAGKVATTQQ